MRSWRFHPSSWPGWGEVANDYRTRLPSQQQPLPAQLPESLELKDHTQGGEDDKACLCPWKREYLRGTSWAEGADVLVMVRNSERTRLTLWFSSVNSCFSFWGCSRNGLSTYGGRCWRSNQVNLRFLDILQTSIILLKFPWVILNRCFCLKGNYWL